MVRAPARTLPAAPTALPSRNAPALGVFGVPFPTGDNGPVVEAGRQVLNDFIRHSGLFDGVEEFDAATLDPATGNMKAVYLPNSSHPAPLV